jgi:Tfp pilus assembly protein PilN
VRRTNLSTRPFYNERAVHLLLALAGVVVVVLTAFNAIRIIALSRQNTELSALIDRDHEEAQRLTREAQRIRAGINQAELETTANAAALANSLIDQRTFSWTQFFNHIEETLPPDVMLTAVRPSFTDNVTTIQMTVLGRRSEDLDEFMEKLEATGAFDSVLPAQRDTTDEGLDRLLLQTIYTGLPPEESSAPVPAKTPPPAGQQPAAGQPATKPAAPAPPPATPPPLSGRAARGGTGR